MSTAPKKHAYKPRLIVEEAVNPSWFYYNHCLLTGDLQYALRFNNRTSLNEIEVYLVRDICRGIAKPIHRFADAAVSYTGIGESGTIFDVAERQGTKFKRHVYYADFRTGERKYMFSYDLPEGEDPVWNAACPLLAERLFVLDWRIARTPEPVADQGDGKNVRDLALAIYDFEGKKLREYVYKPPSPSSFVCPPFHVKKDGSAIVFLSSGDDTEPYEVSVVPTRPDGEVRIYRFKKRVHAYAFDAERDLILLLTKRASHTESCELYLEALNINDGNWVWRKKLGVLPLPPNALLDNVSLAIHPVGWIVTWLSNNRTGSRGSWKTELSVHDASTGETIKSISLAGFAVPDSFLWIGGTMYGIAASRKFFILSGQSAANVPDLYVFRLPELTLVRSERLGGPVTIKIDTREELLALRSAVKHLRICELVSGKTILEHGSLDASYRLQGSVVFSPGSEAIYASDLDQDYRPRLLKYDLLTRKLTTIKLYEIARVQHQFGPGWMSHNRGLAISSSGEFIGILLPYACKDDNSRAMDKVIILDQNLSKVLLDEDFQERLQHLAFSPLNNQVAVATESSVLVSNYDHARGEFGKLHRHAQLPRKFMPFALAYSKDAETMYITGSERYGRYYEENYGVQLCAISARDGKLLGFWDGPGTEPEDFPIFVDNTGTLVAQNFGQFWRRLPPNAARNNRDFSIVGDFRGIFHLRRPFAFTPNGEYVLEISEEKNRSLKALFSRLEHDTLKTLCTWEPCKAEEVEALAVSPDGRYCAIFTSKGRLKIWQLRE